MTGPTFLGGALWTLAGLGAVAAVVAIVALATRLFWASLCGNRAATAALYAICAAVIVVAGGAVFVLVGHLRWA